MPDNPFSAAAAALGYAYQFRYSLVVSLRRLRRDLGWQIALETADDIEIVGISESELLQLKMRAPATTLHDSGADLWKTLRVWCEGVAASRFDPANTLFYLVTTAVVKPGSAAAHLLQDNRNVAGALAILEEVARDSKNRALAAAFSAFIGLTKEQRLELLESVTVVAGEKDITDLDQELGDVCAAAVRRDHLNAFLERLEGWWFRRCLRQLASPGTEAMLAEELESFFDELREQFRAENLPIDWDISLLKPEVLEFSDKTFVHQLRLVTISDKRIGFAVRDYFRAFTQRSRWTRDGLLLVGELERYERKLVEEWERSFERMTSELGPEAAENEKQKAAQELYAWVESGADFPIRRDCNEPFVTRGTYHILADGSRVGWHPDFLARLMGLLEPAGGNK